MDIKRNLKWIKVNKRFAECAIINELKVILENYQKLTGMEVEGVVIDFITVETVGDMKPKNILSNARIINERI